MKATDLPEARARMSEWMAGEGAFIFRQMQLSTSVLSRTITEAEADQLYTHEMGRWRQAELFYVTRQMVTLTTAAAESMPSFELRREDLPSESGLIVFETPIGVSYQKPVPTDRIADFEVPIVAVLWGVCAMSDGRGGERAGVWLSFHSNYMSSLSSIDDQRIIQAMLSPEHNRPFSYDNESWLGFTEEPVKLASDAGTTADWAYITCCAWLLMQQPVSSVTSIRPDRAATRRLQRSGVPPRTVRVITLRHVASETGHSETGREYHHQWIVRGHWRKQWYPSQERHVPIWISPHVKGPDGAPLLGGEKVYAWQR